MIRHRRLLGLLYGLKAGVNSYGDSVYDDAVMACYKGGA